MTGIIFRPTTSFLILLACPGHLGLDFTKAFQENHLCASDIGSFAAQGFLQSEHPEYTSQAISLAGDDLTFDVLHQDGLEHRIQTMFEYLGISIKRMSMRKDEG